MKIIKEIGKSRSIRLDVCLRKQKQSCLPPYVTGWNQIFLSREMKLYTRAITEGDEYPMSNMGKRVNFIYIDINLNKFK